MKNNILNKREIGFIAAKLSSSIEEIVKEKNLPEGVSVDIAIFTLMEIIEKKLKIFDKDELIDLVTDSLNYHASLMDVNIYTKRIQKIDKTNLQ